MRPSYGPDTGKPFFVGGYAGNDYGPFFQRRAIQVEPGVTASLRLSLLFPWSTAPGILSDPLSGHSARISGRVSSPNELESGDVPSHHLESAMQ